MATSGEATITVLDGGGSVVVPGSRVQLVIGCSSAGVANQITAVSQINALTTAVGVGPGPEASALALAAGGVAVFVKATQNAAGTSTAVVFTGTGSSVITVTLDGTVGAFDDYNVQYKCVNGGTRGTTGVTFQISLDAGRSFGPVIALLTGTTYAIPSTGITLNFAAGTMVANDVAKFSTAAPSWNTAGIQSALNAFAASGYANSGVGSIHVVGASSGAGGQSNGASGANATSIKGFLDTLVVGFSYNRLILSARDAATPTAWGGAGETESTWLTAVSLDYSGVSTKRVGAGLGYYNMQSQISNSAAGAPKYRRPLAWAWAARLVAIPPQRHAGRVRDGSLSFIVVDPTNDPNDGFVYHDESITQVAESRFSTARTRRGLQGYYMSTDNLMAPTGSDFALRPRGSVMDIACTIVHQVGTLQINSDLRTTSTGTLYPPDAAAIATEINKALQDNMVSVGMITAAKAVVDLTNNVQATSTVNITVTIQSKAYVLQENITIGFGLVS
jgi:hypothetical protein